MRCFSRCILWTFVALCCSSPLQSQERGDAEARLAEQLSTKEAEVGVNHPDANRLRYQLGRAILEKGRVDDAERLLLKAQQAQEKSLGMNSADTLLSTAQLVRLYKAKGAADKQKVFRDKLEAALKTRSSGLIVRQLREIADKEVAAVPKQAAAPVAEKPVAKPAEKSPSPMPATNPASQPTAAPKKPAETAAPKATDASVEKKLRDNLAASEKALGPEHPDTLMAARELGAFLLDKSKPAEAEPLLKRATDGFAKGPNALGAEHGRSLIEMARLLNAKGEKSSASEFAKLGLAFLERSVGKASTLYTDAVKRTPGAQAQATQTQSPLVGSADSGKRTYPLDWAKTARWRNIGPTSMGGRVVDVAVHEADPTIWYVASASGGLYKTINAGTTFTNIFNDQPSVSIGDVCSAPSNPDIVWVGTGESNARNSASWGDGVYKSFDGGKSWANMGLRQSFQIGKILIHPKNPDVVWVGALGRLWGENEERGVFKTIDGGKSWERILYVDDKTGCIDLAMKPDDPDTILAAMYERKRDNTDDNDPIKRWGPGAGIYKTANGGKNWTKLTKGLPTCSIGRVGFSWYRADPKVVYAIVESERSGDNPALKTATKTATTEKSPPAGDQKKSPASTKAPEKSAPEKSKAKTQPPGKEAAPAAREPGAGYVGILGEDFEGGVKLTQVVDNAPAAASGLKADDVIKELGGKPVASYEALITSLRASAPGDKLVVTIQRDGKTEKIEVTVAQRPAGAARGGGGRQAPAGKPFGTFLGGQVQNIQDRQGPEGFQTGGVYRSADGGETWTRINSLTPRPFYFSRIEVDPKDEKNLYVLGIQLHTSKDGGKTFDGDGGRNVHADHHAIWIDPNDPRRILLGCDGGLYVTYDRMQKWDFLGHLPMAQFYHVAVDTRSPYRVYGGLQDNQSWGAPSATRTRIGPSMSDWINLGGGDGFVCAVDPLDPDLVYYESQNGAMGRVNLRTGQTASIRPQPRTGLRYRFNWKTPFILSSHNPKVFYAAGNYVFRSMNRGDNLKTISPEISNTKTGTGTAVAESPLDSDVLYAGTDDGAFWVTKDGGQKWTNLKENLAKLVPPTFWVDTIECSRFKPGRVYVALDCHRSNNDEPFPLVSEDFGATWKSIRANLPSGSTRTVREDQSSENVLYCGTEFGLWVSIDRGVDWTPLPGLPTVAVHEVAQPSTAEELVVATHGRGMWIVELSPIRQAAEKILTAEAHLFEPAAAILWNRQISTSKYGHRDFAGENPTQDAVVYYALKQKTDKVTLKIVDVQGKTVRELTTRKEAGLHRATWDRRRVVNPIAGALRMLGGTPGNPGGQGAANAQARRGGGFVDPGAYRVLLTVNGKEYSQSLTVKLDPESPIEPAALDDAEARIEQNEGRGVSDSTIQ